MPGGQSRWSAGKDLSWEPLRIERVCEVKYDHLQGDRFRHAAIFLRWRPDKPPQRLPLRPARGHAAPYELAKVFGAPADGCTRGGSPACFLYCGGQGASPCPALRSNELEQRLERAASSSRCRRARSPICAKRAGIVASVKSAGSQLVAPRPRRAAPRRARPASGAPSTRQRWCGPWRSGCSRRTRRGAPPSTTCWSRAAGRAAPPRAPAPAPRGAPRRSSSAARCARRCGCRACRRSSASRPGRSPRRASSRPTRRPPAPASTRTPGTGSRSTRSSSGCSRSSARTGCGCSSRQARFAIQASVAASRGTTSSARAPRGKAQRRPPRSIPGRDLRRALLVEELAADAVGIAHQHVRPAAGAAQRALGPRGSSAPGRAWCARLREQDLAGVRDRHLAPGDGDYFGGATLVFARLE